MTPTINEVIYPINNSKIGNDSTVQFQLPSSLKKKIRSAAYKKEISLSHFCRSVFEVYLENPEINVLINHELKKLLVEEKIN
jgi:hypothetical protein